ncbi:ATP-dependent Clp protease proteolytic subunit [Arsenicicoccus piscis]|uniref:ATP-dependent Clp protease proteolytic subunit n=1 Tax=Arsenicicoccus piscis TaxID=673954 RepID=A0ABQ6HUW2_9MICO|nr:ATP-dependent Clp protease proteolytic subunit [Arsenicicoccus piscis]MCH8627333.1 ATP-dependent Clp protease proteolytic subunit [Arsenicicoccus piscis]GMA21479.1 ATP-dependent Clp protease proteolytic subunit [Arsenicicoccus piscis]
MNDGATTRPGRTLDEDLYRELFQRRTLLLGEALEDWNSNRLCNGLLLLAAQDADSDIRLLINSPGGSVPGMLAIRDCMRAVACDVVTVNLGMAYSAGQFLLSSGTKGKRYAMPHSKVLLHQGSAGIGGTAMDIAIQADDLRHTRDTVLSLVAEDTGQDVETVERDSRRDRWFDAEAARHYGFVDHIVTTMDPVLASARKGAGTGFAGGPR